MISGCCWKLIFQSLIVKYVFASFDVLVPEVTTPILNQNEVTPPLTDHKNHEVFVDHVRRSLFTIKEPTGEKVELEEQ